MIDFCKRNKGVLISLFVLLVYLSPNIFMPNKAHYLVHDNLDSNVVWYKNLAESGKMFSSNEDIIPNSVGGIPRGCYPSSLNLLHLFYYVFSPLTAYNLNVILMHLLAFLSMLVFSRKYIFKYQFKWMNELIALCFALLPFWPSGSAAITCQPLLLYAFLNIYNNDRSWTNWLIIILIPFYSLFVLSNFFFLIVLGVAFCVLTIYKRRINYYFILAALVFVFVTIICEHRLFEMQFLNHFESQRSDMKDFGTLNIKGVVGVSLLHFFQGHYHFHSLQFPFIMILSLLAFVFGKENKVRRNLLVLICITYSVSLLLALPDWMVMQKLMKDTSLIKSLSLRFYSLCPLLWYTILAYSSYVLLMRNKNSIRVVTIVLVSLTLLFNIFSINSKDYFGSEYAENSFYRTFLNKSNKAYLTFDEYYKVKLFSELKKKFPPQGQYVGCIGFYPEIAQYNGYYTMDGYYFYQSAAYNKKMLNISSLEMKKAGLPIIGNNHCLLISSELTKGAHEINNLELDFNGMKELKTKYIISAVKINNKAMVLLHSVFVGKSSLYVYEIS